MYECHKTINTHQTRQRFSNLLSSNFCEPMQIIASTSRFQLTGVAPGAVFCFCRPSAMRFNLFCIQYWIHFVSCTYLGCNKGLFELFRDFYELKAVCPFSLGLLFCHQQDIFIQETATHWMFLFICLFNNPL